MNQTATSDRARNPNEPIDRKELVLENTLITLQPGPAGIIAKIDHGLQIDYAGPIPHKTISALLEVAHG